MRFPPGFKAMLTSAILPVTAAAHDGPHLHPHGAEPATAGLGLLFLLAAAGVCQMRGRR